MEVAEIGAPLPVESQLVLVERIKDRIAEQLVDCTPRDVATGETDLPGQKSEVVATGLIDQEACEEIEGRVLSACEDFRKCERLVRGAPAVVLREIGRLAAESKVKYSRLCELFAEYQLNIFIGSEGEECARDGLALVTC